MQLSQKCGVLHHIQFHFQSTSAKSPSQPENDQGRDQQRHRFHKSHEKEAGEALKAKDRARIKKVLHEHIIGSYADFLNSEAESLEEMLKQ